MRPGPMPPADTVPGSSSAGRTHVPLDRLDLVTAGDDPARPAVDSELLERLASRLERFAESLHPEERPALQLLLDRAAPGGAVRALAAAPAASMLTVDELEIFERLHGEPAPDAGRLRPFTVMIMKATRLCNLRCTYCNQWRDGPNQIMPFEVLARATRDVLRAPGVRRVEFVWHGGEATLLPIGFYRKAVWLQEQFRTSGQSVNNVMQTNATRVSDAWLEFWKRYGFAIGVSLDGPPEIHDLRRLDVAGRPTAARVRAGLERLAEASIQHGVLMVVDEATVAAGPRRLLDYLLDIGVAQIDLLNVLPRNTPAGAPLAGEYLSWPRYVEFLGDVFRLWWPEHAGRISIRELDGLVSQLRGGPASTCVFAGDCFGGFLTVEPSGDVSACDKYVDDPQYHFLNLLTANLATLEAAPSLVAVRVANAAEVDPMRTCPWYSVCRGACPHDRYTTARRRPGSAERCCGMAPLLDEMADTLRRGGSSLGHPHQHRR